MRTLRNRELQRTGGSGPEAARRVADRLDGTAVDDVASIIANCLPFVGLPISLAHTLWLRLRRVCLICECFGHNARARVSDILSWAALGKGSAADSCEAAVELVWHVLADGVLGFVPVGFLLRKMSGADRAIAQRALSTFEQGRRQVPKEQWSQPITDLTVGDRASAGAAEATRRAVAGAEKRFPRSCERARDAAARGRARAAQAREEGKQAYEEYKAQGQLAYRHKAAEAKKAYAQYRKAEAAPRQPRVADVRGLAELVQGLPQPKVDAALAFCVETGTGSVQEIALVDGRERALLARLGLTPYDDETRMLKRRLLAVKRAAI